MAQMDLAQELLCPEFGLSSSYHLALARLHLLRAEYDNAEYNLKEALKDSFQKEVVRWTVCENLQLLPAYVYQQHLN
ncbi:hypothetical protein DPEC_G00177940 [Dallia pectoralis]|uniref:Uncharacterized protein n=1 Tax=Dallia pectoralis TaxID=75939 RepID=A0ACC2GET0_DALPE|nr:hypothetical protein DPEC_G00177940 [Dallia pectoralis]